MHLKSEQMEVLGSRFQLEVTRAMWHGNSDQCATLPAAWMPPLMDLVEASWFILAHFFFQKLPLVCVCGVFSPH